MISVLFARADSNYKALPSVDVWDAERDARTWPGGNPVVAHPPCRAWGRLRHFAKPRPDEKALAIFAVDQVRKWGGVLEHPASSTLWTEAGLPAPGRRARLLPWRRRGGFCERFEYVPIPTDPFHVKFPLAAMVAPLLGGPGVGFCAAAEEYPTCLA